MSKTYASVQNGVVHEIVEPFIEAGYEWPVELRFTQDFINTLVDITNLENKPREGWTYFDGKFSLPSKKADTLTLEQAEELRLIAYAHPVTGIDRHFAEVLSLQAEGFAASSAEVKEAKARGLARKAEIQALYPYPAVE